MRESISGDIAEESADGSSESSAGDEEGMISLEVLKFLFMDQVKRTSDRSKTMAYFQNLYLLYNYIGGGQDAAAVTDDMLVDILEKLLPHKTESGIAKWMSVVRDFFNFCVDMGVRPDNPMDRLEGRFADIIARAVKERNAAKNESSQAAAKKQQRAKRDPAAPHSVD